MPLILNRGTHPSGLKIQTLESDSNVYIGGRKIPIVNYLDAIWHMFVDYSLTLNDPRTKLFQSIKSLTEVDGWPHYTDKGRIKTLRFSCETPLKFSDNTNDDRYFDLFECRISLEDFFYATLHVLQHTNLSENDSRIRFVECIKKLRLRRRIFNVARGYEFKSLN